MVTMQSLCKPPIIDGTLLTARATLYASAWTFHVGSVSFTITRTERKGSAIKTYFNVSKQRETIRDCICYLVGTIPIYKQDKSRNGARRQGNIQDDAQHPSLFTPQDDVMAFLRHHFVDGELALPQDGVHPKDVEQACHLCSQNAAHLRVVHPCLYAHGVASQTE
jgi:hypothetical protein